MNPFPTAILLLAISAGLATAQPEAPRGGALNKSEIQDLAMRASAWVVALSPRESGRANTGTGFLVYGRDRLVVTNAHVVGEKKQVQVTFPWYKGGQAATDRKFYGRERPLEGTVLVTDSKRDLALIQVPIVPNGVRPLKLAKESAVSMENVYMVGNPGDDEKLWRANEATVKRVAARDVLHKGDNPRIGAVILELEARDKVRKGFSGGPVLNMRGELVGILFGAGVADAHNGFAVDVREVRDLLDLVTNYPKRAQALLTPRNAADYKDRGRYYLSRHQYDRTIESFTKAIELLQDKAPGHLYYLRGMARRKQGDARAAIADLTEAIQRDAKDVAAYRERGASLLLVGDYDRAIADYSEAILLDPKDAMAYAGRSQAYAKKGESDKAMIDWQKAVQIDPTLDKPASRQPIARPS
jgi:tetratricopeptide (TPR) repeat protein